jgi:hypothetical protein
MPEQEMSALFGQRTGWSSELQAGFDQKAAGQVEDVFHLLTKWKTREARAACG